MPVMTPGINFLIRGIARFLLPSIISLIICYTPWVRLSTLTKALIFIATGPLSVWATVVLDAFHCRREAEKLDARMTPVWKGKRVANFDILRNIMHDFKVGYPGK